MAEKRNTLEKSEYLYHAFYKSNYDGDTIRVGIDLGMGSGKGVFGKGIPLRLFGINCPEIRGKDKESGKRSRDIVKHLLTDKKLLVETIKDKKGKYGRYLAVIFFENELGEIINLNEYLVEQGYAIRANY